MLFVISGLDKPGHLDLRVKTRPDHLAYWGGQGDTAVMGGPYLDEEGNPKGSLIVIKVDDLAAAQALVDADPYTKVALFESVTITPWSWALNAPEGL